MIEMLTKTEMETNVDIFEREMFQVNQGIYDNNVLNNMTLTIERSSFENEWLIWSDYDFS